MLGLCLMFLCLWDAKVYWQFGIISTSLPTVQQNRSIVIQLSDISSILQACGYYALEFCILCSNGAPYVNHVFFSTNSIFPFFYLQANEYQQSLQLLAIQLQHEISNTQLTIYLSLDQLNHYHRYIQLILCKVHILYKISQLCWHSVQRFCHPIMLKLLV